MRLPWIDDDLTPLPPAEQALPCGHEFEGLVAAGGRLTPERLREAYGQGLFPWYSHGQPVLWWSPDPRMVLLPEQFRISRSFAKVLRRFLRTEGTAIRFDADTPGVIEACAAARRPGQSGTWIVPEMIEAYRAWHRAGAVHSVETYVDGRRVGGLYGVLIGQVFFGESMFALQPEASKIALAALVAWCRRQGVGLIDCQQVTAHLASLGARPLSRTDFLARVREATARATPGDWSYDGSEWAELPLLRTADEDTAP